jgi:tryptophan synthase alpha chain
MNRIDQLFEQKQSPILSIYFTAGYPGPEDTVTMIENLAQAGADMLEIGMPFSDPLADGPVIQQSSQIALQYGMSIKKLFSQLEGIRQRVSIPLLLMGYLNPVMQYGMEAFCARCEEIGIDGLIVPDLPLQEYQENYKELFAKHGLHNIFLITPQTSEQRVREIDEQAGGFLYMVSTSATTGVRRQIEQEQETYFERIQALQLKTPRMIGFGIHDRATFAKASEHARGAIIGSAFIKAISQPGDTSEHAREFVRGVLGV